MSGDSGSIWTQYAAGGGNPLWVFKASNGTLDVPLPSVNGDTIGTTYWQGQGIAGASWFERVILDTASPNTSHLLFGGDPSNFTWRADSTGYLQYPSTVFADLGTPGVGSHKFCVDCQVTAVTANVVTDATCTNGGSGTWATRIGSTWKCEYLP